MVKLINENTTSAFESYVTKYIIEGYTVVGYSAVYNNSSVRYTALLIKQEKQ